MTYDNYEDEKLDKNRDLEFVSYDDWLKNCDKLKYRLNIKEEDFNSHILQVRNVVSQNKIYGFNIAWEPKQYRHGYISVTIEIEEDGIIDSYSVALMENYYIDLLKDMYKHFYTDTELKNNTAIGYDILSFINKIIYNINGMELLRCNENGNCAKFYNHNDLNDPLICNKYLYLEDYFIPSKFEKEYYKSKEVEKILKELKNNDLIMYRNKNKGIVKYGIFNDSYSYNPYNIENPLLYFCKDLDSLDLVEPYKRGFYPFYLIYAINRNDILYKDISISRANIDDLNKHQKNVYYRVISQIEQLNNESYY